MNLCFYKVSEELYAKSKDTQNKTFLIINVPLDSNFVISVKK